MAIDVERIKRKGLITILIVFGGLGIWMATAPLHGAVVVGGIVKVESNRKTIQHNEGGIVRSVHVTDGQLVERGQTLIQLQDASVEAQYGIVRSALDAQLVRQARLHAEATGSKQIAFPEEIESRASEPAVAELLQRERSLFTARRAALDEQLQLILAQIRDIQHEREALTAQQSSEQKAKALADDELQSYEKLRDKQYVAEVRILAQERLVAEYESRAQEREAELARASQRIQDMKMRSAALNDEYLSRAAEELKESGVSVVELRERLQPSEDAMRRQSIVAPVSGRVIGLRIHTEGASIGPREPLMDIVPEGDSLLIEAQAPLDAIRQLHVGQFAEIRFTGLSYRTTPLVEGEVSYVSADALADQEGHRYLLVNVKPRAESMRAAGIEKLDPGMAAEVYVQTESRTAMQYIFRPISDSLLRAFREH